MNILPKRNAKFKGAAAKVMAANALSHNAAEGRGGSKDEGGAGENEKEVEGKRGMRV